MDFTLFRGRTRLDGTSSPADPVAPSGTLFSAGFDLTVETGNILWVPFDGSFGVTVDVLAGNAYALTGAKRFYFGALFSVDI